MAVPSGASQDLSTMREVLERARLQQGRDLPAGPLVQAYALTGRTEDALAVLRSTPVLPAVGDGTNEAAGGADTFSAEHFEPLLVGCVDAADDGGLREAVQQMRVRRVLPTASLYGALIGAHIRHGALPRALGVLEHAMGRGVPPPLASVQPLLVMLAVRRRQTWNRGPPPPASLRR